MQTGYFEKTLEKIENGNLDINNRVLIRDKEQINFLFVSQLTDKSMLTNDIIKPINICLANKHNIRGSYREICESAINGYEIKTDNKEELIIDYILSGMTVIIFSSEPTYLVVNSSKVAKRSIDNPELTYTMRGPRDCFNENIDDNLSLLRYRVKDDRLNIVRHEVGRRTKTQLVVMYIEDIVNDNVVNMINEFIKKIDIDGIVSSGELVHLTGRTYFFPRAGIVERSDMAAGALLEGKVIILVDGSCQAIIAPKLFIEFFTSCDDFYDNTFISLFAKFVRMYSTFLAVTITAIYVAILSFHIDTLPVDFIQIINTSSQGVPFTVLIGALIMELILELIREALIRVPKQIGSAVAVVAGIIIGSAAIAARIFNPLLLIVASISMVSTFTAPDYSITNPLRLVKFFLIMISGFFGLIGFTLGVSIIHINLVSANSFGVPYYSPVAPFNGRDFKNMFIYGKELSPQRPNFLKTKDKTRSGNIGK